MQNFHNQKNSETKQRISRLFSQKEFAGVHAVLLTRQPNIYYFTGFTGEDSWAILTSDRTFLLTDGRFDIQASEESPQSKTFLRKGKMSALFETVVEKIKLKELAVLNEELTLFEFKTIRDAAPKIKYLHKSSKTIHRLRRIKSADEIVRIEKALDTAQRAFIELARHVKPGQTENQCAAKLEFLMRKFGASKAAFETIFASGKNSAKPHARTSQRTIRKGEPITIDFGARQDEYCSDLTRTVCIGTIPAYFREIYLVTLDAQMRAIDAAKPGIRCCDLDKIARSVITKAEYGWYFNHGLGHGLGLDVHEAPALSRKSEDALEPGMIVTIEPGIYIPEKGGVRIEDDILITDNGCRVLSSLPKSLNDIVW
jgi:Xaa-Pro aminopeptidase